MCQLLRRKRARSPSSATATASAASHHGDVRGCNSVAVKLRRTTPSTHAANSAAGVHSSPLQVAAKVRSRCKPESPVCCEAQEDSDGAFEDAHDEQVAGSDADDSNSAVIVIDDTDDDKSLCAVSEVATPQHRDEIVAAILTIASALGLARETLHLCVDVLDRFMDKRQVEAARLERLSIACLWIAVKFMETPATIESKSIKRILQQRRHSGNWTWQEIIQVETDVLRELNFRVMAPTTLALLQKRIYGLDEPLAVEKMHLAYYFADLFLLKHRSRAFAKELLVDAIWYVLSEHQLTDVQPPLLAPVVLLFLAHRDNINPKHHGFKTWFALRCHYGAFLPAPWQVPYDALCVCRVCEHVQDAQEAQDELLESAADPALLLLTAKRSLHLVTP